MIQEFQRRWAGKRVLVVGDLMVDVEWQTEYSRPSKERGGDVLIERGQRRYPGGAANVALNCARLGAAVDLIGASGLDNAGTWLKVFLAEQGVQLLSAGYTYRHQWEGTTVKTRLLKDGEPLCRIDHDVIQGLAGVETRRSLIEAAPYDALLLSDYQKGAFASAGLVQDLIRLFKHHHPAGIIGANPKPALTTLLPPGLDLITVNSQELRAMTRKGERTIDVSQRLGCRYLLHTMGARGLWLSSAAGEVTQLEALPVAAVDPCGCGDSVFAAAMLALTVSDSVSRVAAIANAAGAAAVGKRGTRPVSATELFHLLAVAVPAGVGS